MDDNADEARYQSEARRWMWFRRNGPMWAAVVIFAAGCLAILVLTDTDVRWRVVATPPSDVTFGYERTRDLGTIARLWDDVPERTRGDCPTWAGLVRMAPELGAPWIDARARDVVAMERGEDC